MRVPIHIFLILSFLYMGVSGCTPSSDESTDVNPTDANSENVGSPNGQEEPAANNEEPPAPTDENLPTDVVPPDVPPDVPPYVVSTYPDEASGGFPPTAPVVVVFSEAMDSATISEASFKVANQDGEAIAGAVSSDGSKAKFRPLDGWQLATTYTVAIAAQVSDETGNGLESEYSWSFSTPDSQWIWGRPELIGSHEDKSLLQPDVVVDGEGNAMAIWLQPRHPDCPDGVQEHIVARRRIFAENKWDEPENIERAADEVYLKMFFDISVGSDGSVYAAWSEVNANAERVPLIDPAAWANRFDPQSGGWEGPQQVFQRDAKAFYPQIVANGDDGAMAAWLMEEQTPGSTERYKKIWAGNYTKKKGWDEAQPLYLLSEGYQEFTKIKLEMSKGLKPEAVMLWTEETFDQPGGHVIACSLWSSRYSANHGWDEPLALSGLDEHASSEIDLEMSANGNTVVVWQKFDYSAQDYRTWASIYLPDSGWQTPALVSPAVGEPGFNSHRGAGAIDDEGNVIVVGYGFNTPVVWSSHYNPVDGWSDPVYLETRNAGEIVHNVSMELSFLDDKGNALAVWAQQDENYSADIWASAYVAGEGWTPAILLENNSAGDAYDPKFAVDPNGIATIVWHQNNGQREEIWSTRVFLP